MKALKRQLTGLKNLNEVILLIFKDKTLLLLTHRYPNAVDEISNIFVKNYVDSIKKHFEKIIVIATVPYIPNFLGKMKGGQYFMDSICNDYSYDNVQVFYCKVFYFPASWDLIRRNQRALKGVISIINEYSLSFDLIHAHFTAPSGFIAAHLKEVYEKVAFLTIHENYDWLVQEAKISLNTSTWSKLDGIIRVNKKDLSFLSNFSDNIKSIPNGFDDVHFKEIDILAARNHLNLNLDNKIIFSLGHLIPRKGFDVLLESVRKLRKIREDFELYIGGDGPSKKDLQKYIDKNKMDYVKLLGRITNAELPYWMFSCNLFALTSHSEGNPTVMFEALGCGKPVLSTDVGGVSEIISSSDYGQLVDFDSKNISEKLNLSLSKQWDYSKIKIYASNFTWDNIGTTTLDFFSETIKKGNS